MVYNGQTDRQTNGRIDGKWHVEVGDPPKNKYSKQ